MPSLEGNLLSSSGMKFAHKKLQNLRYHMAETRESLSHLGLNWYRVVTEGRTDRITAASMRLALRAVARKKTAQAGCAR